MKLAFTILLVAFHLFGISISAFAQTDSLAEAGIPSLDRKWADSDYIEAARILQSTDLPLPRMDEPSGKAFFKRLTATENLWRLKDREVSSTERLKQFLRIMNALRAIAVRYSKSLATGLNSHPELAQITAFSLRMNAAGLPLIEEVLNALPAEKREEAKREGFDMIVQNTGNAFADAERTISQQSRYSPADRSMILTAMVETLPSITKTLTPEQKSTLRTNLEADKSEVKSEDSRNIQKMLKILGS